MALVLFGCSEKVSNTAVDKKEIVIGVQLWSVKEQLSDDFSGTLVALSNMGFEAVEFAGVFGPYENDPEGLKLFLSSIDLTVSGAHTNFKQLSDENIEKTLTFYKALGANYLMIPWDVRAWHPTLIHEFMADLNRLYPRVKKAGFEFGFHNHDQEFTEFNGETYWDFIAKNSDPEMKLQLDIGWVNFMGLEPIDYVKKYAGRTLTTHYKVRTHPNENKSSIIGEDNYDWLKLFDAMKAYGGTQWVIVEQEEYPRGMTELEAVAASKKGLDKLLGK